VTLLILLKRRDTKGFRGFPEISFKGKRIDLETNANREVTPRNTLGMRPNVLHRPHGGRINEDVVNPRAALPFNPEIARGKVSGEGAVRFTFNVRQVRKRERTIAPGASLNNTSQDFRVLKPKVKIPAHNGGDIRRVSCHHEDGAEQLLAALPNVRILLRPSGQVNIVNNNRGGR
jgi:hypothetical protein